MFRFSDELFYHIIINLETTSTKLEVSQKIKSRKALHWSGAVHMLQNLENTLTDLENAIIIATSIVRDLQSTKMF